MKERTIDEIEIKLLKWFKIAGVVECGFIKLCGVASKPSGRVGMNYTGSTK